MSPREARRLYWTMLGAVLTVGAVYTLWSMRTALPEGQRLVTEGRVWEFAEQPLVITD